jgi:hypothetical protein
MERISKRNRFYGSCKISIRSTVAMSYYTKKKQEKKTALLFTPHAHNIVPLFFHSLCMCNVCHASTHVKRKEKKGERERERGRERERD